MATALLSRLKKLGSSAPELPAIVSWDADEASGSISGFLWKERDVVKSYRARFFRLDKSILYYYIDDDRIGLANLGPLTKPRGTIYLAGCTISREPPREPIGRAAFDDSAGASARAYPFTIRHPASSEATRLATDSEAATAAWVALLGRAAATSHLASGAVGLEPGAGVGVASPAPAFGLAARAPPPAPLPYGGYGAGGPLGAADSNGYHDIDLNAPSPGVATYATGAIGAYGESPPPASAPPPPPMPLFAPGGASDAAAVLRDGVWTALVSEPLEAGGGVLGGNKNVATVALRLVRRGGSAACPGWDTEAGQILASWGPTVQRREKDFARLHEYLGHEVGATTLPKLPSKGGLLGGGGGGGAAVEGARYRERLQHYLDYLFCQPLCLNSHALKMFLTASKEEFKQSKPREPSWAHAQALYALPTLPQWAAFTAEEAFLRQVFSAVADQAGRHAERAAAARARATSQAARAQQRGNLEAAHEDRVGALAARAPAQEERAASAERRYETQRRARGLAWCPEPQTHAASRLAEATSVESGANNLARAEADAAALAGALRADHTAAAEQRRQFGLAEGASSSLMRVHPLVRALLGSGAVDGVGDSTHVTALGGAPAVLRSWATFAPMEGEAARLRAVRAQRARLDGVLHERAAVAEAEAQALGAEEARLNAEASAATSLDGRLRAERGATVAEGERRAREAAALDAEAELRVAKERAVTAALEAAEAGARERAETRSGREGARGARRGAAADASEAAGARASSRAARAAAADAVDAAATARAERVRARLAAQRATAAVLAFDTAADEAERGAADARLAADSAAARAERDAAAAAYGALERMAADAAASRDAAGRELRAATERAAAGGALDALDGDGDGGDAADPADGLLAAARARRELLREAEALEAAALGAELDALGAEAAALAQLRDVLAAEGQTLAAEEARAERGRELARAEAHAAADEARLGGEKRAALLGPLDALAAEQAPLSRDASAREARASGRVADARARAAAVELALGGGAARRGAAGARRERSAPRAALARERRAAQEAQPERLFFAADLADDAAAAAERGAHAADAAAAVEDGRLARGWDGSLKRDLSACAADAAEAAERAAANGRRAERVAELWGGYEGARAALGGSAADEDAAFGAEAEARVAALRALLEEEADALGRARAAVEAEALELRDNAARVAALAASAAAETTELGVEAAALAAEGADRAAQLGARQRKEQVLVAVLTRAAAAAERARAALRAAAAAPEPTSVPDADAADDARRLRERAEAVCEAAEKAAAAVERRVASQQAKVDVEVLPSLPEASDDALGQAAAERAQLVDALAKATLHAERAAAAVGAAAAAAGGARTALDAAAAELSGAHAALDEPASPLAPQWNSLRALPAEPPAAEMAAPGFDVAQWQLRQALATTAADRVELAPQLAEQHDRMSHRCAALAEAEARCAQLHNDLCTAKRAAAAEYATSERWAGAVKRLGALRKEAERAVQLRAEEESTHSLASQNAFWAAGR